MSKAAARMPPNQEGAMEDGRLSFWLEEGEGMISLQAVIAASFVGKGCWRLSTPRGVLPSLAEMRANIWEAACYFASLEAKKDRLPH